MSSPHYLELLWQEMRKRVPDDAEEVADVLEGKVVHVHALSALAIAELQLPEADATMAKRLAAGGDVNARQ